MKRIASFEVNHDKLKPGMYTSRIDGDITTYDIRMVKPNCGTYLPYPAIHSFEHLFATYVRSSELSDQVIYVGPMGCRTGFYFLVEFTGEGSLINTLETQYRRDERVIRFLTFKQDKYAVEYSEKRRAKLSNKQEE